MMARQQQVPGTYNAVGSTVNGMDVNVERAAAFSWEDWFRHASPQQRVEALGLAHQQGLVYPHQLPFSSNGVKSASPAKETEVSAQLSKLLCGKPATMPTVTFQPISFFDTALDDLQKQAVERALNSPDIFLLQGMPGTGKSRVVTEIILQYAAHGRRVLFLAGHSASLDVVLERLAGRSEVFALRLLDANEKTEALPPLLRGFTLEEQKQAFLERVLAGARHNRERFETNCRRRSEQTSLWSDLQTCAEKTLALNQKLAVLIAQIPAIAGVVERELETPDCTAGYVARVNEHRRAQDGDLQEWEGSLKQKQDFLNAYLSENAARAIRIAELDPGYQAKKQGRIFSVAYWVNLFNGTIVSEMERLLDDHAKATVAQADLQKEIDQIMQRCQDRRTQFEQERNAIVLAEIEERRRALASDQSAIEEEQRALNQEWDVLCAHLNQSNLDQSPQAILAAQQAWHTHKQYDEQQCQFARQWTDFIETAGPQLATRLPSLANVVAGTIQRWHADVKLHEAVSAPFDLLIVEDAETLVDADLQKLSRFANRCTLVSQSIAEAVPLTTSADQAIRSLVGAPLAGVTSWRRLWQALGGDAWRGHYTWHRDQGRLVCQLLPLVPDDQAHLESEGLADAPDIELRILHAPNAKPRLAQVIFGPQMPFEDAFAFLMREIQEFPIEPIAVTGWWDEQLDCLRLNFGHQPASVESWLTLEPGLRVGAWQGPSSATPRIACLAFDRSVGWDRCNAEAWLRRHRASQDHERTAFLQTAYRYDSHLAKFVQTVMRPADWQATDSPHLHHESAALEFIAVPAVANHDWPREGAGLELDLSATRHADRLPVGLRQSLPARGFVNYLEAQALIRRLETWMAKESPAANRRVVVLALYQGQVELLRRLAEQSEALRARAHPLEITLPSRMTQRECDVVFLSLTRSHGHRATAFGETLEELPIALTRASKRLCLFGDPGTLNRRTQWNGPLEYLDGNAAAQELLRIKRLVACLRPSVPPAHANGKL